MDYRTDPSPATLVKLVTQAEIERLRQEYAKLYSSLWKGSTSTATTDRYIFPQSQEWMLDKMRAIQGEAMRLGCWDDWTWWTAIG